MPEHNPGQMGGTMRLGKRRTIFKSNNSVLRKGKKMNSLSIVVVLTQRLNHAHGYSTFQESFMEMQNM